MMIILLVLSLSTAIKNRSLKRNAETQQFQAGINEEFSRLKIGYPCLHLKEDALTELMEVVQKHESKEGFSELQTKLSKKERYDKEKCKEQLPFFETKFGPIELAFKVVKFESDLQQKFTKSYNECKEALNNKNFKEAGKKFTDAINSLVLSINAAKPKRR